MAPTAMSWVTSCCGLPSSRPEYAAWTAAEAKMPVAMAPNMPPTPWTAKTSSASSTLERGSQERRAVAQATGDEADDERATDASRSRTPA